MYNLCYKPWLSKVDHLLIVSPPVSHEEEKVCLKEVYSAFYHRLVGAITDVQVCQSLSAQLRSSAVIPEEKISCLVSSRASGSSFLNILGVEEQSGLVAVLIKAMSAVEQLQTLASEMNDLLRSKQSTLLIISDCCVLHCGASRSSMRLLVATQQILYTRLDFLC